MFEIGRIGAQRQWAERRLSELAEVVAFTRPGARNVSLNRAALTAGHLVATGALDADVAERRLCSAGAQAGLSPSEARATVRSGLSAGMREPAFGCGRYNSVLTAASTRHRVSAVTDDRFSSVAESLVELCPLGGDVAAYLRQRGLPSDIGRGTFFALPRRGEQAALIDRLLEIHGQAPVAQSRLVDFASYAFRAPEWRLGIAWRDGLDGSVATIQRRHLGAPPAGSPKTLFAKGRPVNWPLMFHELARLPQGKPVVILEGAIDWLAWHGIHDGYDGGLIALPSAMKLRPEWIPPLIGRDVFVCLDGDDVGERTADAIVQQLARCSRALRVRPWPGCKDWADWTASGSSRRLTRVAA